MIILTARARNPREDEEVKTEQEEDAGEGEQVPKLPPKPLTLKEPKQESSSQSPKQSPERESASSPVKPEVPPLVSICISPKKQPLSLARAAGEKVAVGFKMDEVEAMAVYRSQQGKLLQNVLGGWDPRRKCFRKCKYALVLLSEVEKCGGAPIKHKNWTIVRAMMGSGEGLVGS